jgi:hypothetical protein
MRKQQGSTGNPLSLFISYAHGDELLRQQLEIHLSPLRREGLIADWHDHQILAGDEWARDIDQHLEDASIILLLISPDFLSSDYCYEREMQRALERDKQGQARVIPLILRPCDWQASPIAHLQCLPRNAKPITTWNNQDEAFATIAKALRKIVSPQRSSGSPLTSLQQQNRGRLLKQVRMIWIKGLLENPLYQAAWIDLHFQEQHDALENPWRFQVQELDQEPCPLPVGTSIVDVYDEADGKLLILGEPGGGKTTLLLHLARTLLDRAEADEHLPMPVVFNLSSWAQKQESLAAWLVEELKIKYQVQYQVGQHWIKTNQVLPLLDGLDEVAVEVRAACAQAIIAYYRDHLILADASQVLCCRSEEYRALSLYLPLQRAVSILPLTDEQIYQYLSSAESQLEGLRQALHNDAELFELAHRPLILSIFTLAYQGVNATELPTGLTQEHKIQQIFDSYVKRMLSRRRSLPSWMQQDDFLFWLISLAKYAYRRQQTVLSVEDLQPDWLSHKYQRWYHWSLRLVVGLGTGLVIGLGFGTLFTLLFGLRVGLLFGLGAALGGTLLVGLVAGSLLESDDGRIHPAEVLTLWWKGVPRRRLVVALVVALGAGLLYGLEATLSLTLSRGLALGLGVALIGVLASGVSGEQLTEQVHPSPNKGIWYSARNGLSVGLVVALAVALVSTWLFGLGAALSLVPASMLFFALNFGLFSFVQHFLLRLFLWRLNYLPRRLVPFLDEAAERLLLRKIGGSYLFMHRLLLEYFATLETPSPKGAKHLQNQRRSRS